MQDVLFYFLLFRLDAYRIRKRLCQSPGKNIRLAILHGTPDECNEMLQITTRLFSPRFIGLCATGHDTRDWVQFHDIYSFFTRNA